MELTIRRKPAISHFFPHMYTVCCTHTLTHSCYSMGIYGMLYPYIDFIVARLIDGGEIEQKKNKIGIPTTKQQQQQQQEQQQL